MATTPRKAAHRMCEAAQWTLSHLSVQKGLYLAHMTYLGITRGAPLINENFQAWDYGPVLPSLYQDLKMFGRRPVKDIFWLGGLPDEAPESEVIDNIARMIKESNPAALVQWVHHPDGAWAKHYSPGIRGIVIPNTDILEEYDWRPKRQA